VRVTNLERAVADVLDRPSLAGGVEEVWGSLLAVPALDPEALLDYVEILGNRTLVARVGFSLETRRAELAVPERLLERLQDRAPNDHPVYLIRVRRGTLQPRWRLIVPDALVGLPEEGFA